MTKNCTTCLHARPCGIDMENAKVCLNAGTFVYNVQIVSECPGHQVKSALTDTATA
ncbi:hypothetical protein [Effusibacillus lacus]|uniref:hypothetical protein n=1 Tax=Effusibacillus lacus TaxID=1348429 RepID=UPI0010D9386A|nr:hypothetical protein [Effusibacillus lacus]TCS74808.1 hypothetical protein EDD64_11197 [Effusibacillus lacus]